MGGLCNGSNQLTQHLRMFAQSARGSSGGGGVVSLRATQYKFSWIRAQYGPVCVQMCCWSGVGVVCWQWARGGIMAGWCLCGATKLLKLLWHLC